MRIVLALMCDFYASHGFGTFPFKNRKGAYVPTTLTTLAALVPKELNADIRLYDEFVERFDYEHIEADLVGLSFTTPNAIHAYRVADRLRERGITVVLGGYHTSLMPEEAQQHADACVLGYAENAWPSLLRDFARKNLQKVYQEDPSPGFRQLVNDMDLLLDKKKYYYRNSMEFSRNCVNDCKFCVISNLFPSRQYFRDLELFKADIRREKPKEIVLLDSSPAENKTQFYKLCQTLKELNVQWDCNISFRALDDLSMIAKMAECGCTGVLLGFESINQASLNAEHKQFNQVARYKSVIAEFHKHKILIFGTFVFGFDADDPSIFDATIRFVKESKIDLLNFSPLIPFPGTRQYQELEAQGRILTTDWSQYDGKHAVFKPMSMTEAELMAGVRKAYKEAFSLKSILSRALATPRSKFHLLAMNLALAIFNRKAL
jgi:radical SAM superfamily enzyme YgiQ (UPF0313 family)